MSLNDIYSSANSNANQCKIDTEYEIHWIRCYFCFQISKERIHFAQIRRKCWKGDVKKINNWVFMQASLLREFIATGSKCP